MTLPKGAHQQSTTLLRLRNVKTEEKGKKKEKILGRYDVERNAWPSGDLH